MSSWSEILNKVTHNGTNFDIVLLDEERRKYITEFAEYRGRNVITYYSGWMYHHNENVSINDKDVNAFMEVVHKLDKKKGLDLILPPYCILVNLLLICSSMITGSTCADVVSVSIPSFQLVR